MTKDVEDRGDEIDPELTETTVDTDATDQSLSEADAETPAPAPAADVKPRNRFVPRERFDEVSDQLREARHRASEIENRLRALETPKAPAFDAEKAERDYLDAVAEGDKDKARDLWTQIRRHERARSEEQITSKVRTELDQHAARVALESVAETLAERYPFLDPTHETANEQAINEVVEWRDYYHVARRMPMHQALKEAVRRVAPAYAKLAASAAGIAGGADRTQAQKLANAKAAASLPPNTSQAGLGERATRATALDVSKMSEADFSALPAAERSRLRGDTLA